MWIAVSMFTWHITTNVQTLCWSKTSPSFSGAHSSCISRSIKTIFVPQIGMYIRINMSKTDFIYLQIWCDSVTFCQRGHFFDSPCIITYHIISVKEPTDAHKYRYYPQCPMWPVTLMGVLYGGLRWWQLTWTLYQLGRLKHVEHGSCKEMKWWCFRPLLCTLFRLNWAKLTPGIRRRN